MDNMGSLVELFRESFDSGLARWVISMKVVLSSETAVL